MKPEHVGLGIHRAVFLDALVHLLDPSKAHFHKRCVGVKELHDSRMQISFADGMTAEADVVLGTDGVRSNVRTFVLGAEEANTTSENDEGGNENVANVKRVAFTNTLAYRGLVPTEQAIKEGVKIDLTKRPHCFVGLDKVSPFPPPVITILLNLVFSI